MSKDQPLVRVDARTKVMIDEMRKVTGESIPELIHRALQNFMKNEAELAELDNKES